MNIRNFFGLPAAVALVAAMIMQGCNVDKSAADDAAREMYEHITPRGAVLIRIDVKGLLENAGAEFSDGCFAPGEALQLYWDMMAAEMSDPEEMAMVKVLKAIDMGNVVLSSYAAAPHGFYITAPLRDKKLMMEVLEEDSGLKRLDPEQFDDGELDDDGLEMLKEFREFEIFVEDDIYYMVRGNQIYATDYPAYVVDDYRESASGSVASDMKLYDLLTGGTITMLTDIDMMEGYAGDVVPEEYYGCHLAVNLTLDGIEAEASVKVYDEEYEQQRLDLSAYAAPLSAGDFRVLPSDANLVAGVGCPTPWVLQMLTEMTGFDYTGSALIEEFIGAFDGPVVAGITMPSSLTDIMNPAAWKVTLAIGFDEEIATTMLSWLQLFGGREYAPGYVIDVPTEFFGSIPLYMGYMDGSLVVSTSPLSARRGYKGAGSLEGATAGARVSLPAECAAMRLNGYDFGIDAGLRADSDGLKLNLKLTDTDMALLATLLWLL